MRLGGDSVRRLQGSQHEQRQIPLVTGTQRIAILQNNIRQLVQQAAGSVGARDEERISDRIAQQNEELEKLTKERDALLNR
jgi:hypothetical protein